MNKGLLLWLTLVVSAAYADIQSKDVKQVLVEQHHRQKTLSDLDHKLETLRKQLDIAKTTKDCQAVGGCLIVEQIGRSKEVKKTTLPNNNDRQRDFLLSQRINSLVLTSIISEKVVFLDFAGFFSKGDTVIDGVHIKDIRHSAVVLDTKFGDKILNIDWSR